MTKSTMDLIQARIDEKMVELDYIHNTPPANPMELVLSKREKKTDTLSELTFLWQLIESLKVPMDKEESGVEI